MEDIGHLLFEKDYLNAFEEGATVWLVRQRNQHLGAILSANHKEYYIQILHRMLYFRREHELEPLNEDIYIAVKPAITKTFSEEYTNVMFNQHMDKLLEWELLVKRLEKERLRNYRDDRRDRFRYRLADETVSFLYWLEDRLRGGDEDSGENAWELLDAVFSRLKDIGRDLGKIEQGEFNEDDLKNRSSRVVFQLHNVNEYTQRISRRLSEVSARMEEFLLSSYSISEAQEVIDDLHAYHDGYLKRITTLRQRILVELETLHESGHIKHLNTCFEVHSKEQNKAPRFMRNTQLPESPDKIIEALNAYYLQQGQIDKLCTRVNTSAMKVWGKLSAHLRELERKNNRCEEIARRIKEISVLPENVVPTDFIFELLSPAAMTSDPNYWDKFTKASPPQPKFHTAKIRKNTRAYLPRKKTGTEPVVSMEAEKISKLKQWIERKFSSQALRSGIALDSAEYNCIEDFQNVITLGKKGILGKGKALKRINYKLETESRMCEVVSSHGKLRFIKQFIREINNNE